MIAMSYGMVTPVKVKQPFPVVVVERPAWTTERPGTGWPRESTT